MILVDGLDLQDTIKPRHLGRVRLHLLFLLVPLPDRSRAHVVPIVILSPCRRHVFPKGDIDTSLDGWGSDPVRGSFRDRMQPIRLRLSSAAWSIDKSATY